MLGVQYVLARGSGRYHGEEQLSYECSAASFCFWILSCFTLPPVIMADSSTRTARIASVAACTGIALACGTNVWTAHPLGLLWNALLTCE